MVHPEIQLTAREKIQFLWLVPLILFKTALTLISTVLTDTAAAIKHPIRTIGVNLLRHATLTLSFRQKLAADVVSTGDAVVAYCAARKLTHHAVRVPVHDPAAAAAATSGTGTGTNNNHHDRASTFHAPAIPDATLHLITVNPSSQSSPSSSPPSSSQPSSRTILYLHGGGFVHPLNARAQLPFAHRCAESLSASSSSSSHPTVVTLAVLEYHLAPARRHPTQLAQSLAALRALVVDRGVPPGEVVLMGDSAGGNLLLGVLAALKVAAAAAAAGSGGGGGGGPQRAGDVGAAEWWGEGGRGKRLAAAVAVCPWCRLGPYDVDGRGSSSSSSSYVRNARWDFLGGRELGEFEEAVGMERVRGVVWGDAVGAARVAEEEEEEEASEGEMGGWGGEFWSGVVRGEGSVVERMLVSVGTREVFYDDVVELVRLMETGVEGGDDGKVVFVKGPREVHVGPVVDVALGVKDEEGSLPAILEFFKGL